MTTSLRLKFVMWIKQGPGVVIPDGLLLFVEGDDLSDNPGIGTAAALYHRARFERCRFFSRWTTKQPYRPQPHQPRAERTSSLEARLNHGLSAACAARGAT
jgi:hypothetical protein